MCIIWRVSCRGLTPHMRTSEAQQVRQHTSPSQSRPFYRSPSIPTDVNSWVELLVQSFHIPDVDLAVL